MFMDWYFAASDGRRKEFAGADRMYGLEPRLAAFWAVMKDSLRACVARDLMRQDFEQMTDAELADIGIERSEIPIIVKSYPAAGRLQRWMMARLGLDRENAIRAWPAVMRAAAHACEKCDKRKRCKRWLESGASDESYRAFCPNSYRLAAMKLWQARRDKR
jgi:uncharacterized protein YjiS (DUF1127 family)